MNTQELILGSVIMSKRVYEDLLEQGLNVSMFTGKYQTLFEGITQAREDYAEDIVALQTIPKGKGITTTDVASLVDWEEHESWLLFQQYFEAFKQEYWVREWKKIISFGFDNVTQQGLFDMAEKLSDLASDKTGQSGDLSSIIQDVTDEIQSRHDCNYSNPFRTGFEDYDRLGHFEPGSLAIIAGQSGHGKSTFALNLAYRWIDRGLRILYVTYEMSSKVCLAKLNIIRSKISWNKVFVTKDLSMTDAEYHHFLDALEWFRDKPLVISEYAEKPEEIELLVKRHNIDVFVIDTVNFLTPTINQFWLALGNYAKSYKSIARRNKCLAIMIAQGAAYEGRPKSKNQLAESKRMKNDADYIDFLYREAEEDPATCHPDLRNVLEIFRVKGRLTGTGQCYLEMKGELSSVDELGVYSKSTVQQLLGRKSAGKR